MGWMKRMVQKWLQIQPALQQTAYLTERSTNETRAIINKIWYRGDADELDQLYKQIYQGPGATGRFWAASPKSGIRKIHTGLPAIMVDTLVNLVRGDLPDMDFTDPATAARWEELAEEIGWQNLIGEALTGTLVEGDGAFKLSIDASLSDHPLVEFAPTTGVDLRFRRGHFTGANFRTMYTGLGGKVYELVEEYQPGRVGLQLLDNEQPAALSCVPELSDLKPVEHDKRVCLAVPFRVFSSSRWPGRGASIYEKKTDAFDALDEVASQWLDAVRAGRVKQYIPEDLLPKSVETGGLMAVNDFGSKFIALQTGTHENDVSKIDTVQPEIRYEAYLSTYMTALDMCLQGILSPATLGIDVGKMSSGEAQREKKDVTGNTRNAITAALEQVLPKLAETILQADDIMHDCPASTYEASITFGEYGAPDFDSRVETVAKARAAGIMSDQAAVDELWGSSKEDDWKAAEVKRIQRERGIMEAEEPAVAEAAAERW